MAGEKVNAGEDDALLNEHDGHECSGHKDVERKHLMWTLGITLAFVVAEIITAAAANSLSLVADALHHLVDAVIIVTALLAVELVRRVEPNHGIAQVYVDEAGNRHYSSNNRLQCGILCLGASES
jgi:predicted Co/Zn/Cd cation transporter (cation efflux family)